MKMSKISQIYVLLGLSLFLVSVVLFFVSQKDTLPLVGLGGMLLFWVMGIQNDLYHNRKASEENN